LSSRVLRCRQPRERPRLPALNADPAAVEARLADASHRHGRADAVCAPVGEGEWAGLLSSGERVLVVGAQSSLTGGATPSGGIVAETAHLRETLEDRGRSIRLQPGLPLSALQEALLASGRWFPPVPTFEDAFVGGVVSTDAAGARTFRHGTTRRWVRGLTAMLPGGQVVELERGQVQADDDGRFLLEWADGSQVEVQLPMHQLPDVPKCSAGYRGGAGLDLVDLFAGAEGTLGVLLEIELDVAAREHGELSLAVPVPTEAAGLAAVAELRELPEVAAIEFLDSACLNLLREDGYPTQLPEGCAWLLLIQLEFELNADEVMAQLSGAATGSVAQLRGLLERQGADLSAGLLALPGDARTRKAVDALREAAPRAVNARLAAARRATGEDIVKVGGDAIVPFDRLEELLVACRSEAETRELDLVMWGHVSDANLHPNVVARSAAEVGLGESFLLAVGRRAIELGGSPLAEHGVGRHPLKQRLLRELVGDEALAAMRGVKAAFDPEGLLAPGVLFSP